MNKRHKKNKPDPEWLQRLKLKAMVRVTSAYVRILRLTCRIRIVAGSAHLETALSHGAVIPCTWHRQMIVSGLFLRALMPRGLRLGFLVSPSRDGNLSAGVLTRHDAAVMRGSATRTGSRSLRALIRAVRKGISPAMFADGPHGPSRVFKPGTVFLARATAAPVVPLGCAVDRYWQINSWDQTLIPKPFARLTIAVGELWPVDHGERRIDEIGQQVGDRIDELTGAAETAQRQPQQT